MTSTLDTVKNRVRELRGNASLSQGELAGALGVSRQTINSIETGRYLPSLPLAMAMASGSDGRYRPCSIELIV